MFYSINPKITNAKVNGRCIKVAKDGLLNDRDKNYAQIVCRRCSSIFFPDDRVEYIENNPVDLRVMTHQAAGPLETERISWWWYTNDDMDFDTIGWQTVDNKKVLMCGDCELGPIGYRTEDNSKFYVAVERVSYKPVEDSEESEEKKKPVPAKKTPSKGLLNKATPGKSAPNKNGKPIGKTTSNFKTKTKTK